MSYAAVNDVAPLSKTGNHSNSLVCSAKRHGMWMDQIKPREDQSMGKQHLERS